VGDGLLAPVRFLLKVLLPQLRVGPNVGTHHRAPAGSLAIVFLGRGRTDCKYLGGGGSEIVLVVVVERDSFLCVGVIGPERGGSACADVILAHALIALLHIVRLENTAVRL
jgi:hypothetical protein